MSTDIYKIMHKDPDKLTKADVEALIDYARRRKGKRQTEGKLDLRALGLIKDKPKFERRF
jgi:hypothetical protein